MTDLTEKWKAGELEEGWYYIKYEEENEISIAFACEWIERFASVGFEFDHDVEEVIAAVPSYEELQSLESDRLAKNEGEEIVSELKQENARLKGLLREFKEFIKEENPKDYTIMSERMDELLTKIEEVLK